MTVVTLLYKTSRRTNHENSKHLWRSYRRKTGKGTQQRHHRGRPGGRPACGSQIDHSEYEANEGQK